MRGSTCEGYLGNFYSEHVSAATEEDVGRPLLDQYVSAPYEPDDENPLASGLSSYELTAWWLGKDDRLVSSSVRWTAAPVESISAGGRNLGVRGGFDEDQAYTGDTLWTGQISFQSPPPENGIVEVHVGPPAIRGTLSLRPNLAVIRGDRVKTMFTFKTGYRNLSAQEGDFLAVKVVNRSDTAVRLLSGGAWCYVTPIVEEPTARTRDDHGGREPVGFSRKPALSEATA